MTDFSKLSGQELNEALNFHRRQRNMSRGINEAAHVRQTQMVRMLEAEEARRLNEEKPNKYVIYKHKDKYGVSQDIGTGYNWDHSYHHGYHDTVDAAKEWAAKHAGKYPHKIEVKEEADLDEEFGDYSSKKTSEKKSTIAHPDGKPIHHILHKGEVVGTIEPYSAYREKRKPGSRIVSSRTNVTKYSVHFHADKGPTKSADMPLYHKLDHTNVQSALKSAAEVHSDWLKKSALKEEVDQIDEISKSTLGSYATKALHRGDIAARMSHSDSDEMGKIANKRTAGVKKAVDRLAGKKTAASIKSNIDKAREAARNRGTDRDDQGKAYYAAQKGISKIREEADFKEEVELEENFKEGDKVSFTTDYGTKQKGVITNPHTRTVKGKRHAEVRVGLSPNTWSRVHVPHHRLEKVSEEVELDEGYNDPEYIRRAIPALRNAVDFHKELSNEHDKKSTSGSPEYVRAHSAAAKAHREAAERHKIAHAQLSHGSKDVEYYVKPARELGAYAEKLSAKANALKEEAETNYVIKHKKTKQVLNTHSDYATAKDEHEGLGADKHEYGIYKQTKKDAALRNRNTYREEVEQIDEISNELKAKYLDKAVQSRYDRFIAPRNGSAPKLKGNAKKAADAAREKANVKDSRRARIIDKTSEKLTGKPHYDKMSTLTSKGVEGNAGAWWKGKKYSKEEVELDEANKPNQYIEVTNKFTGAKSYHEVHPSKAFAALNHHNSLWSTKSSRIVSGKEAEGIRASKIKKEEVELDEAIMQGSKEHLKKLQGMLDNVKPGSADHSQIMGAISSMFGKEHIPEKHRNVKPDMYEEIELEESSLNAIVWAKNVIKPGSRKVLSKKFNKGDKVSYAGGISTVEKHDEKDMVTLSNPKWSKNRIVPAHVVKEEVELDEASDLRITKVHNKWPKKATYAVHSPDRKYYKEFDSMEAAKAHRDEKTSK